MVPADAFGLAHRDMIRTRKPANDRMVPGFPGASHPRPMRSSAYQSGHAAQQHLHNIRQ